MSKRPYIFLLALACVFLLASCALIKDDSDEPNGESVIYIAKDGVTEYSVVYSNVGVTLYPQATELFGKLMTDYVDNAVRYEYTERSAEKEILIGNTDRQLSKDIIAYAEGANGGDDIIWGYAYRDGKLAYYANCREAVDYSWDSFLELILKKNTVEVKSDLWVAVVVKRSDHEAYLKAEQERIEAERKKEYDALLAKKKAEIDSVDTDFGSLPSFASIYGNPTMSLAYSHPRVWVNSDTLPSVIASLEHSEHRISYIKVKEYATTSYTGKLGEIPENKTRNFTYEDSAAIEALAFMYLVTNDELYGYSAIAAAKNFLNTVKVIEKPWEGSQFYNISLNCSTAMGVIAEVYDWCYDLLSARDKEQLVEGVINKLSCNLEVANPPTATGCVSGHSTGTPVLRDWLAFAIAVADEYPAIYDRVVGLIEHKYAPAPNWYYHSGANFQGSAYGIGKTYLHMISEMLVLTATGEKLYADDLSFVDTVYTFISYMRPDGELLRIGDDYNQYGSVYSIDTRLMVYGTFYYKDPIIKAWAMAYTDNYADVKYCGWLETTPLKVLLLNDPSLEYNKETKDELSLVNYNGSPTGAIIARSSWADAGAWMTYTKIGEAYGANHEHKDAGTFQIYYKGILVPDTGAYQYNPDENQGYGSEYDLAYVKQTVSKNGLLIYNPKYATDSGWVYSGGQTTQYPNNFENSTLDVWLNKTTSRQADELGHDWAYDESGALKYAYISGDITNAYDKDTVDLVMRSTISIATGNESHPLLFIVYDRIISDDASFKKSYLLHTTDEPVFLGDPTVNSDANGIKTAEGTNAFYYTNTKGAAGAYYADNPTDKYNGKLTSTTLLPENPTFTVIGGDGKRFWVNGHNVGIEGAVGTFPVAEIGWGRVEISPSVQSKTDSFLNVMYVGDADKNDPYVPATLVKCDTHEGAVSFDNCVMFSKSNKPISDTVSFTTESDGKLSYYVTGLAGGEWQVSLDGRELERLTVKEDSGLAVFETYAGNITLTLIS